MQACSSRDGSPEFFGFDKKTGDRSDSHGETLYPLSSTGFFSRETCMNVTFIHACQHCRRTRQLAIELLGTLVKCSGCGRISRACDRDLESAALLDTMKEHAELRSDAGFTSFSGGELPARPR